MPYVSDLEIEKSNSEILIEEAKELGRELQDLNNKYGELTFLNRNYMLQCPECGYKEIVNLHEKIKNHGFGILSYFYTQSNPFHYPPSHILIFVLDCECPENNIVQTEILYDTLKVLREERNFFEKGIPRPYEQMII